MELAKKYKVRTYTEMILGLPEETLESWKEGFATILENGQHESIDIWFCQVFGNTELNSALSREVYGIETVKAEDYLSFTNTKHSNITEIVGSLHDFFNHRIVGHLFPPLILPLILPLIIRNVCHDRTELWRKTFSQLYENLYSSRGGRVRCLHVFLKYIIKL